MKLNRWLALVVISAFAFAVAGCDSVSGPSDADVRQCILATRTGIDSISQVEFGKTMASQGGMMELAMGAPKDTKIFPVNIHFPSGESTTVMTYWAFKDSFGQLKCVMAPGAETRTYQTPEQVAQAAERRRVAAAQQAEQARIQAEQARLSDEARKREAAIIQAARATATPLGQCDCVDFGGGTKFRYVITTASVSAQLVEETSYALRGKWTAPTSAQKAAVIWFDEITQKPTGIWGGARSTLLDRSFSIRTRRDLVHFYCQGDKEAPGAHLEETYKLLEKAMESWKLTYPNLTHW